MDGYESETKTHEQGEVNMALDQDQLDKLVERILLLTSLDPHDKDPLRSFAQKVANVLVGDRSEQKELNLSQFALVMKLSEEMDADSTFVSRLKATKGFPRLPSASANVTSAPASAAGSPTVTTTPPPVTATASAGGTTKLTVMMDEFNSAMGTLTPRAADIFRQAAEELITTGQVVINLPKKRGKTQSWAGLPDQFLWNLQAEIQNDPSFAALALPLIQATATPTVTTPPPATPATGATPATTTTPPPPAPPAPPAGGPVPPPPPPATPAPPAGGPVPPPPPPATPAPGATKREVTVGGMVIGLIVVFFLGWICLEHVFPFVAKAMVRGGNEEQIERLTSQLKSCNEQVQQLASARDQVNNLRRDAEKELKESRANVARLENQIATSDAGKLRAQLQATRQELSTSTAAVDSWRTSFLSLKMRTEEEGRRAAEKAQDCNAQILALREDLANSKREIERLDTLSRQLQDPNNIGVPIDVDFLSFHLKPEVKSEVRIKRCGELQFQCFPLPGAGAGHIGTSPRIYRTTSGVHLYEVWCNGTKIFDKQVLFVPGTRTQWARVCGRQDWDRVERTRPFLLVTGNGSERTTTDPDVNLTTVRR